MTTEGYSTFGTSNFQTDNSVMRDFLPVKQRVVELKNHLIPD